MHALGIEAMLKREGKAVTGQPGLAQQPGVGPPAGFGYSQPGYAQGMQGYSQPGFGPQPAPSAPYGMAEGGPMTPPPAYSNSKEKFYMDDDGGEGEADDSNVVQNESDNEYRDNKF